MLYYLSLLRSEIFGFNVFSYITFRSGAAAVTAFLLSLILGPRVIQKLISIGMVNKPKVWGPKSHEVKTGIAVGGGLLILFALLGSILLWAKPTNRFVLLAEVLLIVFGALGFYDDHHKIMRKREEGVSEGVSSALKFSVQVLCALGIAFYFAIDPPNPNFATVVNVPYMKETYIYLNGLYFFLLMLGFVGFANSVNLADGLDGLAIGNLVIAAGGLIVFVYVAGHAKFSQYLKIIPVADAGELAVVLAALIGAGLGFLWFNSYPAQVFMGDTGSLPLGALLAFVTVASKQELLLPIIGGVFVVEALSVVAQISFFKVTKGKRIFRMAPLHHHFELGGVAEPKVTTRFWIAGVVLVLVALASLKVR